VTSRVNLSKITLEKKGQSVSLAKKSEGFGQIRINLNWSRPGGAGAPSAPRPSGGFFGKLFGGVAGSGGIDLDLGCFIELNNGTRTVVQALGNQFGDLEREPYIRLSRDDRTGMVTEGEDLLLNGTRWSQVRRVLIYAFIYQGAANWDATDGVVTVYVPNEPPLEVRLTHGRNDRGMCAIASLENVDNGLRVTKLVEYFRDHREMDQTYRWGFRWSAGSKD
jgi:tellurite resistance protein TerA